LPAPLGSAIPEVKVQEGWVTGWPHAGDDSNAISCTLGPQKEPDMIDDADIEPLAGWWMNKDGRVGMEVFFLRN
jgi:hypothetical protein